MALPSRTRILHMVLECRLKPMALGHYANVHKCLWVQVFDFLALDLSVPHYGLEFTMLSCDPRLHDCK